MEVLDVVYVNYNSTDCLIRSIGDLQKYTQDKQLNIVVVDNASNDNADRQKTAFPKIKFIQNRKNVGFGAAINQALAYCKSNFIILLNPDSFISHGFIETSIQFMRSDTRIGIMGPMIRNEDGSIQGSARAFPTPLTSLFGRNSPITKMFPNNSITRSNILTWPNDKTTQKEVDWVSGACMVARKEAILSVGGFDKRFFLYWEDADLCRRIKQAGWKVVYFSGAQVIHSVGKSSNTRPVFANFQFHKNCYRLYDKYAKWPFSIFTPLAGVALMLRFLSAASFYPLIGALNRIQQAQKRREIRAEQKKGKIRILRVISRMNIGGPSIHVKNLTEGTAKTRFTTILIIGSISPNEGDMSYITKFNDNVRIVVSQLQREINPYKDLLALSKITKIIYRFKPDIVDSHTSKAGTLSRLAAFFYNIFQNRKVVTVHTFHGNVLDGYFSRTKSMIILVIERLLAKITNQIIAISETQKWELSNNYRIAQPDKIATIKLGFDLAPFLNCSNQRHFLRKKLGLTEDTLLIGIVGRMAPIKNHRMFLDVGKLLVDQIARIKIKFILVGDGEERQSLETYAQHIGISEHVIFYGWEKNIPMIYADIDILALTSLNEGTPVSVIEAMAASVPVVTTGVGGIKDLLGRFEAEQPENVAFKICERGILCPKDDPVTFYAALNYMIETDYLKDKRRFSKARDYVVENYSVERLMSDMEKLYEKLLMAKL